MPAKILVPILLACALALFPTALQWAQPEPLPDSAQLAQAWAAQAEDMAREGDLPFVLPAGPDGTDSGEALVTLGSPFQLAPQQGSYCQTFRTEPLTDTDPGTMQYVLQVARDVDVPWCERMPGMTRTVTQIDGILVRESLQCAMCSVADVSATVPTLRVDGADLLPERRLADRDI